MSGNKFDPDVANPGMHTISYSISNGACSEVVTQQIFVKDAPEPALRSLGSSRLWQGVLTYYNCDTSATNSTFNFYNQSFALGYSSYQIDFGDGNSATGTTFPSTPVNPISHTYGSSGLYQVKLTLYNSNGCSRSSVVNVFFGEQPAIGFNIPGGAINQCLPQDSGYIEICVAITNVSNNSPTLFTL
ncbi:MAG: PKD domain-containing protein [Owenweeksia sp.]|nr:PKD domain-containing protein [Owenweeksia sp.]